MIVLPIAASDGANEMRILGFDDQRRCVKVTKETIGQFDFKVFKRTAGHDLPMHPFVQLLLTRWGSIPGEPGVPAVSASLTSDREIEFHVDRLKADLDAVAARAKSALRDALEAHRADPSKY